MGADTQPAKPVRHLFAYGTLRPHLAPPEIRPRLAELERVGSATLPGARLYDLGEFPAAVPASGDEAVQGEVYRLPKQAGGLLRWLDEYEERELRPSRSLFVRHARSVRLRGGRRVRAWVYFYNRPVGRAKRIASGRFG